MRTVDTDVVVIAIMVSQTLPVQSELWVAFDTGKRFRYLPAHDIAADIGYRTAQALPIFHALTGCDTASAYVGHGKKAAWSARGAFPELTDALLSISAAPSKVSEECIHTI